MRRAPLLLAICAALAGCVGPRPKPPALAAVDPPAGWRADPGMVGFDPAADWWRSFGDPVLAELVERALARNTDVAIAAARVMEADASYRSTRAAQLPILDINVLGVPREQTYSTVDGSAIRFTGYKAELGASYDTDLFGKLRAMTRAARADLLATRAAQDAVRIAVVASVVSGYVQLRETDALIDVLLATRDSRAHQLQLVTHQAREGYTIQTSVTEASAQVHDVEEQLADALTQQREQEDQLSIVVGDAPRALPRGRPMAELPLLAAPGTVPARLLRRRPDIAEAEQRIISADRSLDAARAAFMPDITLAPYVSRADADLLPSPLTLWSFAGSILAPLFEGGKLRAQADAAAAKRDEAALTYRATALKAFGEVNDALASLVQLSDKERAALAAQGDYQATLGSSRKRFFQGHSSYLEVLDAERGLLTARQALLSIRMARLLATVRLYQAMGGGWSGLTTKG